MISITAQPCDPYFPWQVEVQIVNFRKFGLSNKMHVLVWYPNIQDRKARGQIVEPVNLQPWFNLGKKYPEVKFFYFKDVGMDVDEYQLYIPQIRPQVLAKHFDNYPSLKKEVIFYHDSDIILNFLPDLVALSVGSTNWVSDTSHYLDYEYMLRKEHQGNIPDNEAIKKLCSIGNISVETFKNYTGKTGGAQYVLKDIDGDFWREVERQSMEIRRAFTHKSERGASPDSINSRYFESENAGFQSWCADMWAVEMALWSRGKTTNITKELEFSMATDSEETYKRKPIMHNAGAVNAGGGLFFKADWKSKSPIGRKLFIKPNTASWHYAQAIMEVK